MKMASPGLLMSASLAVAAVAVSGSVALGADEESEVRRWTDASGSYSVEARLADYQAGQVTLALADGRKTTIPLAKLSRLDQQFVREYVRTAAGSATKKPGVKKPGASAPEPTVPVAAQAAGEWASWRGPGRDGISHETGLLREWPADGPPQAWAARGLGSGYSSVAVAGGKIFTMGVKDGEERLIALSVEDGAVQWETPVGGDGGGPNCTPTVDGGRVYAVGRDGALVCANVADGKVVWRKSFAADFGGAMMSDWGYSESPLIDGDRLICTPGARDAMLAALDKRTGETIWKTATPAAGGAGKDGAAYSSVVISHGAGVKQYVQLVGRGVIGVEAESGRLLWGYNRVANGTANVPTPLVKGDLVFCSTGYGDGGSALLRLAKNGREVTAKEVYYLPSRTTQNHHGGMILLGDNVFMGEGHNNGFPLCMKLESGEDVWRPGRGPGSRSAAICYADERLYFRYEDGTVALIEATPERYQVSGTFKQPGRGPHWPHPVVAGGKLYLRAQDELFCYDVKQ